MAILIDKTHKLTEVLTPKTERVLIVSWHGMGDLIMTIPLFESLKTQYPTIKFDVGLCKGLGQEALIPDAVLLEGNWREECTKWPYDVIFCLNFFCEDINNPTVTKAELACINELGIAPVSGYPKIKTKGIVGISLHCTSVGWLANADEETAKKIWQDVIDAGFIPIEMTQRHIFFNPENKLYPFVDKHLREWPANIDTLAAMISKCDRFISAVGGPFHLAMSILGKDKVMLLERDIPAGCFTHEAIATANLKDYKHEVLKFLTKL